MPVDPIERVLTDVPEKRALGYQSLEVTETGVDPE